MKNVVSSDPMESVITLAVVVPAYQSGAALWFGVRDLLRWSHRRIGRVQLVIVDDGSPHCAVREGSLTLGRLELVVLVNLSNQGQSLAAYRGFRRCHADWTVFLDDDLRHWSLTLDKIAEAIDPKHDLINVARPSSFFEDRRCRAGLQPLIRRLFRRWAGVSLDDPTSPIKAVPTSAARSNDLARWANGTFYEGLAVLSQEPLEIAGPWLTWDDRCSRYSIRKRLLGAWKMFRKLGTAACCSQSRSRPPVAGGA
ncbi:MAG: glycosyltransferase [bacterium]|nr:glycosyltransferase [bacterium]